MSPRTILAALALAAAPLLAQTANLYTKPVAGAAGGLAGRVDRELTHALALHHDHKQCFRAELSDDALHPNARGYDAMTAALTPLLQR